MIKIASNNARDCTCSPRRMSGEVSKSWSRLAASTRFTFFPVERDAEAAVTVGVSDGGALAVRYRVRPVPTCTLLNAELEIFIDSVSSCVAVIQFLDK